MRLPRIAHLTLALVVLTPASVRAQDILAKVFDKVTDMSAYYQTGNIRGGSTAKTRGKGLEGYGFELLFATGPQTGQTWTLELALGYNYLTGFGSANPAVDLRGSIRGWPEVSVYATYEKAHLGGIEPYVGIHTGIVQLWHAHAYDANSGQYDVNGETFQAGATAGAVFHGLWAEGSYRVRDFTSLDWKLADGVKTLPAAFPRALDLSGWHVRLGYQFSLGKDKRPAPSSG